MFSVNLETREIFIYDTIGPAYFGMIDGASVVEALAKMAGQRVKVRLNTPGGSVSEAVAIHNAIKRHPGGADTIADSLAASGGSLILQAGQRRLVAKNAMVMVHDPWMITYGNADMLRKDASMLDSFAASLVASYAERTGKTDDDVRGIMQAETWYTAAETVSAGFADEVADDIGEAPQVPAGMFAKTPDNLVVPVKAGSRNSPLNVNLRARLAKLRANA